jgi:hypothetical protein
VTVVEQPWQKYRRNADRKYENRAAVVTCIACGRIFAVKLRGLRATRFRERLPTCHLCQYKVLLFVDHTLSNTVLGESDAFAHAHEAEPGLAQAA